MGVLFFCMMDFIQDSSFFLFHLFQYFYFLDSTMFASGIPNKSRVACILFFILKSTISLLLCPYNKVEESFALQASHDLYYQGITPLISKALFRSDESDETALDYDHLHYPGGKTCFNINASSFELSSIFYWFI